MALLHIYATARLSVSLRPLKKSWWPLNCSQLSRRCISSTGNDPLDHSTHDALPGSEKRPTNDACVSPEQSPASETAPSLRETLRTVPSPRKLKSFLDKYVVGQDQAKRVMSVAVYNHYMRINDIAIREHKKMLEMVRESINDETYSNSASSSDFPPNSMSFADLPYVSAPRPAPRGREPKKVERFSPSWDESATDVSPVLEKSNILLLGPSGTGKTLIARTLANVLDVPFAITDCTRLTQAGYVGEDVDVCIQSLLAAADYDVDRAQRGIVVLDECDKLAKKASFTGFKDISGEGVQQALLKLVEGTTVEVTVKGGRKANMGGSYGGSPGSGAKSEKYVVDTSQILFVFMGAFVGLDKHILDRVSSHGMGFGAQLGEGDVASSGSGKGTLYVTEADGKRVPALDLVTPEDLTAFGLIPELVGRVPVVSSLAALSEEDLLRILTEPSNALLKQYVYSFDKFGVKLVFTAPALKRISAMTVKQGTGARGLRGILEKLLLNVNYECPGSGVAFVLVDEMSVKTLNKSPEERKQPKYYSRGQRFTMVNDVAEEDDRLAQLLNQEFSTMGKVGLDDMKEELESATGSG